MHYTRNQIASLVACASFLVGPVAMADVVTDWNMTAGEIVSDTKPAPPAASRMLAIVHTAMYEAANAVTKRYPASGLKLEAAQGASVDAAVAAAARTTLVTLLPSQRAVIDSAYLAALNKLSDAPSGGRERHRLMGLAGLVRGKDELQGGATILSGHGCRLAGKNGRCERADPPGAI